MGPQWDCSTSCTVRATAALSSALEANRPDPADPAAQGRKSGRIALDRLTDGQLVLLALNGRPRAFPVLVARHRSTLQRAVARRLAASPALVDDLLQQVILAAWRNLQHYDSARSFQAWLIAIARNRCRDQYRQIAARRQGEQAYALWMGDSVDDRLTPERVVLARDLLGRAATLVADLPETIRNPLLLQSIDGAPQQDIAAGLGISAKAVEMRVRRARQSLRAADLAMPS